MEAVAITCSKWPDGRKDVFYQYSLQYIAVLGGGVCYDSANVARMFVWQII